MKNFDFTANSRRILGRFFSSKSKIKVLSGATALQCCILLTLCAVLGLTSTLCAAQKSVRERTSLNSGWSFHKVDSDGKISTLVYDNRLTGNHFIKDVAKRYERPENDLGVEYSCTLATFDDSSWEKIDFPHDWAIAGSFMTSGNVAIGSGMVRLSDSGKSVTINVNVSSDSLGRSLVSITSK
jgi:hypothetical protein